MAEESVILLKNENSLLPLDVAKLKSIAVIGPNADQVQFGDYCWTKSNRHGVTVLGGLRELAGDKVRIHYAKGCDLVGLSRQGFAAAVEAAKQSDVAVVVIGDTSMILSGVGWEDPQLPSSGTVGEGYDVTDPVPPGVQMDLVKAVHSVGKPTIVVMLHGRPYSVPWMKEHVAAILSAFYPGEEQGHAIADILFGHVNPSGRLPVSVPQSAGHIPTVYDYLPAQRGYYHVPGSPEKPGRDYVFSSPDPLWSFGFGLSYTNFGYSDLRIETPVVSPSGSVRLSVVVTNSGGRAGKEVAQVYFRDEVSLHRHAAETPDSFPEACAEARRTPPPRICHPGQRTCPVEHGDEAGRGAGHVCHHGRSRRRGHSTACKVRSPRQVIPFRIGRRNLSTTCPLAAAVNP